MSKRPESDARQSPKSSTTQSSSVLKRRDILKTAVAGAALATTGCAVTGQQNETRWDKQVDVVVIGSGTGLTAALVAAKAGKKVLVLEKFSAPGGNTGVSGGVVWVPLNHVMAREGLKDNRDDAKRYLTQIAQGQADESLIDAYLDNGPAMLDFVETHSTIDWRVSKMLGPVADYHPDWQGSNVRGRSVEPEMPTMGMAGGLLISKLLQAVLASGAELMTATAAERLLTETQADGRVKVIGVQAMQGEQQINIAASDGVLVASGGFERNWEMKKHYLRGPSPYTLGSETNTGDGIRMGMAIGADLRNMNEAWGMTVYKAEADLYGHRRAGASLNAQIERRNAGCISVNRYGERFCNEAADYDSTWRSYHQWENWGQLGYRNMPAFQIFGGEYRSKYPLAGAAPGDALPEWVVQADTLRELAEKLGIDAKGLEATVSRFNQFAEQGKDEDFHRGESPYDVYGSANPAMTLGTLNKGPYYGAEVSPADIGTCGGLRVNDKAQVVSVFGEVIEGLYASGNTAGVGGPGAMYGGGGGTIGPAMTFAYIAGLQMTS